MVSFTDCTQRLLQVFDLPTEEDLAALFGLTQTAWAKRKMRDSFPVEACDKIIATHGLNPEYIYQGTGRVYVEEDGHTWHDGFVKRLGHLGLETTRDLLVREGHKAADIKAVVAGKQAPSMELLRDFHRVARMDLNWLVSGDMPDAPSDEEQALLKLYRKAGPDRQKALLAALVMADAMGEDAAPKPAKIGRRAGNKSLRVAGNVSGGSLHANNNKN